MGPLRDSGALASFISLIRPSVIKILLPSAKAKPNKAIQGSQLGGFLYFQPSQKRNIPFERDISQEHTDQLKEEREDQLKLRRLLLQGGLIPSR